MHKANISMYLRDTFALYMLIVPITRTPLNHLNEISDTQTILMYESSG